MCHFIRSTVAISSPSLYVEYITMLEALCKNQICATFLFRHFNSNHGKLKMLIIVVFIEMLYDWAGLFGSLRRYVDVFRRKPSIQQFDIEAPQIMRRQDLIATMGWIRLATTICKHVRKKAIDFIRF